MCLSLKMKMVSKNLSIESIKELSKTKAKEISNLSAKKHRDREGLFIVEGEKNVLDTLSFFKVRYLVCTKKWISQHIELEERYKDELLISDQKNIDIISSLKTPPEVVAVMEKPKEITEIPKLKDNKYYLLLDEIQDPGNLGTIIRTCDWFGIYEIYASPTTTDVYGPKVVQSTMGSLSRVRVHYLDLEQLIRSNREIKLIGTLLEGVPLATADITGGGMILMGNEGNGISEKLKKYIDLPVTIPPENPERHPDSLNVAIATAIIVSKIRALNS